MMSFIAKKLYNLTHPVVGEIWCLHHVTDKRSPFPSNRRLAITPGYLDSLITEYKQRGYRFVGLDEFVQHTRKPGAPRKLVNISFDDGYRDIVTEAYPVLRRHNTPFTVYVSTDMADGKADLWWMQLEQLAHGDCGWFEETLEQIWDTEGLFSDKMHTLTSSSADPEYCRQACLSWDELRILAADSLCTIGSHGVTHAPMVHLNTEERRHELAFSKQKLEAELGTPIRHFSYPHSLYFSERDALVRNAGYDTDVVGYGGKTRRGKRKQFFYRKEIVEP